MSRDTSLSTRDDGPLDGFLINTIWGLTCCNIIVSGIWLAQLWGLLVL